MDPQLRQSLTEYQYLRERLAADFPEADETTLRDTLEGLSTLPELLAGVVRSYLEDLALAAALGLRLGDMQERLARIEERAEKKRALVTTVMERAGLRRLAEPDFTASLRNVRPGVVVLDEAVIPAEYWVPQPAKLDRQGLALALRGGKTVPGAALGSAQTTISVKTK